MIKLTVHGLTEEQSIHVKRGLRRLEIEQAQVTSESDGTYGITVEGHTDCNKLVDALRDDPSCDYLA